MNSKWIDISRPVHARTAVWPGDHAFHAKAKWAIPKGDSVTVHTVTLSLHTGTHADAPSHVLAQGGGAECLPLEAYLGPAYVIRVPGHAPLTPRHLLPALHAKARRILVRSSSSQAKESQFPKRFTYVTPDAARVLVQSRVRLIGLDSPSVDPFDSKTLDAHKILFKGGLVVLENLWLKSAGPGWYDLCALPLRLKGLDASPVRAVLRRLK